MKKISMLSMVMLTIIVLGCKNSKKEAKDEMKAAEKEIKEEIHSETIKFMMEPKNDSGVSGEVSFTEENGEVKMMASLTGLSEGEHAIHIHEKADCSSADGKSTGGHWNPTFQPHGKWGDEGGYHRGDIGNFTADAQRNATIKFATKEWCIGCNDDTKNILGKAVIVHQGVDDFTSQPSGAAGARVACTGIIK